MKGDSFKLNDVSILVVDWCLSVECFAALIAAAVYLDVELHVAAHVGQVVALPVAHCAPPHQLGNSQLISMSTASALQSRVSLLKVSLTAKTSN